MRPSRYVGTIMLGVLALVGVGKAFGNQKTWIVIGDSIMSRVGDGEAKDLMLHLISAERNVIFKNISSPGATLGGVGAAGNNNITTAMLDQICGALKYCDGIIIEAGLVDFSASVAIDQTETSIHRILDYARSQGKKVLVADITWSANENVPNALGYTVANYRSVRATTCASYADVCTYADRAAMPLGFPSTTLYASSEVMMGNQVHLNTAGHRVYADWIEAVAEAAGLF